MAKKAGITDQTLTVVVMKVAHRKEDSGWCILTTDAGTCKGVVPWEPRAGERLRLVGGWDMSKFSSKQEFSFGSAMLDIDLDARALLHYAMSQTSGIGEAREMAIWDAYGDAWRCDPDLVLVDGLTLAARENWRETLRNLDTLTAQAQAMAWCLSHGCTDKLAALAWTTWREQTIGIISHDPYRLAELPGRGFAEIDTRVARPRFGIAVDDPRRVDAALIYVLKASDGDTLMTMRMFEAGASQIGLDAGLIPAALNRLTSGDEPKVMRFDGVWPEVCLIENYKNELAIWQRFGKGVVA